MALLTDSTEDASSHLSATGIGTNAATFTMPDTPRYEIQSVLATVDNAAGGDTTGKVTVADSAGEVIATKRQVEVIPAGDTGTATFALRITDDRAATATGIQFNKSPQTGGYLEVTTTGPAAFSGYSVSFVTEASGRIRLSVPSGVGLIDLTAPFFQYLGQFGNVLWENIGLFDLQVDNFNQAGQNFAVTASNEVTVVASSSVDIDSPTTTLEGGNTEVKLPVGATLTVYDHLDNPIFRVDEDGDLHGLTGKALVFDL